MPAPARRPVAPVAALRADQNGRPHLADPAWTLHEAARLQSRDIAWPQPYLSGRDQLYRELARQQQIASGQVSASVAPDGTST